jgi:hypothetical protein
LKLNGYKLLFNDAEAYEWLISLDETGRVNKLEIGKWLRFQAQRQM